MNNLKSYTEYAVSTPTTDFVIGFDFNYGTDAVNVTVDNVPATEAGYSVIYLNSTTMRLSPAVPSGVVRLQRETDIDVPDNQFTAGAKFIASNMDENFTQLRHAQQEVRDGFGKLSEDTYEIIDTLQDVGQAAQDAADAAEQAAQTANDAAAQVNDKVSYQDLDDAVELAVAPVRDYTPLPFEVGKNYNLNERVVLGNGDIVRSAVAGNTTDPNVSTVGWENFAGDTRNIKYANYIDARTFGIIPDKITDWTSVILGALATLPESSTLYVPQGVKWAATSNPDAVYAAMPDNSVLIDDSGYEDSYSTKYWQGSRQVYFKTKDYGSAGQANGNVQSYRFNYNGGISFENDAPPGSGACKGSLIWRFNKAANREAVQIAGDMTTTAQANLGVATYGGYANGATALRLGLQSSIAPHCLAINSALVQDCSFQLGKRVIRLFQGTPETDAVYKAAAHVTRISQPSGHTGNFETLFYYGGSVAHREILEETGRYRVVTKNSKTLTTTADGEQFGGKLSVLTPTANTLLSEPLSGSYYSNLLAGGGFTITLPKAIKGTYFEFSVDVAQNLVIAPNAVDNFVGMGSGKTKISNVVGSHLRVVAISASQWSFVQSGTWTNQA